ncbi:hypothetical protein [Exiguobacterium sp. N4-1P]|uniref:hypothetical protein n=2 Tax=Bacteria TaxID=2 RepID=UPI0012FFAA50|nr:hypothetical protein [Exiguobacterium sp. N4-1P]
MAGLSHPRHVPAPVLSILVTQMAGLADLADKGRAEVSVPESDTQQSSATTGIRASRDVGNQIQVLGMNDPHGDDPRNPLPTRDHWSF